MDNNITVFSLLQTQWLPSFPPPPPSLHTAKTAQTHLSLTWNVDPGPAWQIDFLLADSVSCLAHGGNPLLWTSISSYSYCPHSPSHLILVPSHLARTRNTLMLYFRQFGFPTARLICVTASQARFTSFCAHLAADTWDTWNPLGGGMPFRSFR